MKEIIKQTDRLTLQKVPEISPLVRCSLILIQAYVSRFKIIRNYYEKYFMKRPFADAESYFSSLMHMLIPEKMEVVIDTIMDFLRKEQLWKVECVCCKIFCSLLSCRAPPEILLRKMLDYIEEMITVGKNEEPRHVVHVLFSIIKSEYFSMMPGDEVIRLMRLYNFSVQIIDNDKTFYLIRTGFEMVLVKLMGAVSSNEIMKIFPIFLQLTFESNLTKIECKEFGSTLRHGFARMRANPISQNLRPEFLKFLLTQMTSNCDVKSFLATHFLAIVIDRQNNLELFSAPMIFHEYTNYELKVGAEVDEDARKVFEENRSMFETAIIGLIKMHCSKRDNLNIVYSLMCVIISSIPCDFIIVFTVCILMNLQRFLIDGNQNLNQVQINHIHSMIASIMTLVCWVTRAKSLTKYVHSIVNLRYDDAPHFNPPLNYFYEYAEHHILHHKQELFFNSWELRYCLWKRFRLDEELLPAAEQDICGHNLETSSRIFKLFQKKPKKIYKITMVSS